MVHLSEKQYLLKIQKNIYSLSPKTSTLRLRHNKNNLGAIIFEAMLLATTKLQIM